MQNGISYVNTGNSTVSSTPDGTSNVFQILNDIWKRQRAVQCQYNSSTVPTVPEMETPFRTTTPSTPAMTTMTANQVDSVHAHTLPVQNTSWSAPPACCAHVHKLPRQVFKPGDSLALRKVQHLHNGRTCVNRLPLTKQDIVSHYLGCFEGIGCFRGDPYMLQGKFQSTLKMHSKKKSSLVQLGILEEVKEHTDWVNSHVIVEKDSGNHHSPNHTIKRKLRIIFGS